MTEARNAKYSDADLAPTLSLCGRKTVSLLLTCFHRKPLHPTYISRFTVDGGRARQAADDDNKASCSPTSPDHLRSLLTCLPFSMIALVEDRFRSIEHRPYRHEHRQHPRREDTKSLAARAHSTNAVSPWAVETRRSHPRFARPCHHVHVPESRYPSIPPSCTPHAPLSPSLLYRHSWIHGPGSDTPRHAKLEVHIMYLPIISAAPLSTPPHGKPNKSLPLQGWLVGVLNDVIGRREHNLAYTCFNFSLR